MNVSMTVHSEDVAVRSGFPLAMLSQAFWRLACWQFNGLGFDHSQRAKMWSCSGYKKLLLRAK